MALTPEPDADELVLRIVHDVRALHLELLRRAVGVRETAGSCFHACILLQQTLERFTRCKATVRGGGPQTNTGYFDGEAWRGHYWVELSTARGPCVVDVTADQFGAIPVVVLPLQASLGRYRPDEQLAVDDQVAEFLADMEEDRAARVAAPG